MAALVTADGLGVWWLIACVIFFVAGVFWIYRPSAKNRMNAAARMPLDEDD